MTETLESAYRQHADELIRFATTMVGPDEASDVVTDAMIAVFARRDADDDAEHVDIANLRAYLFRAVHHRIVDGSRSAAGRHVHDVLVRHDSGRDRSGARRLGRNDSQAALQSTRPTEGGSRCLISSSPRTGVTTRSTRDSDGSSPMRLPMHQPLPTRRLSPARFQRPRHRSPLLADADVGSPEAPSG
jgi:hypothetical protein